MRKLFLTILLLVLPLAVAQEMIELPTLSAPDLNGRKLKVLASTAIIADVLKNVAKDLIDLQTMIKPGQSSHAYKPTAREIAKSSKADVIFINGWNLEEKLLDDLKNIAANVPIVAVSANIEPIVKDGKVDPHSWLSIDNVITWTKNIEKVLSDLDPKNAENYHKNSAEYISRLKDLKLYAEKELAKISPEKRFLITNHAAFSYFARDYDFKIPATIIPSMSSLAEPSARDMASLIETLRKHNICSIFSESDSSDKLARSIANELKNCQVVKVLPLHAGTFDEGSSYIEMFKQNIDTIVKALSE